MTSISHLRTPPIAFLLSMGACTSVETPSSDTAASPSFALRKQDLIRRGGSDDLIKRLAEHPYGYFRALAEPFARRVCAHFADQRWTWPMATIHGDAHVEQYVVTQDAYGLEDFDQSGFGLGVIDLVRFASSIHLACRGRSFACRPASAVTALLDGYAGGIRGTRTSTLPSIVERVRRKSSGKDALDFLSWAEKKMLPIEPQQDASIRSGWERFIRYMVDVTPDLDPKTLELVRFGRLKMGIGSALAEKYLFRVRGPTDAPEDDLILEAKRQTRPGPIPCLSVPPVGGMLRPVVATSLLGRRRPAVLGYAPTDEHAAQPEHVWVQSWTPGYYEVSIKDLTSQRELEEIAFDGGHQLGSATLRMAPEWTHAQVRWVHLRALERSRAKVGRLARELADEVVEAWQVFRSENEQRPR